MSSRLWDEEYLTEHDIGWRFPSADGGEEEGFNISEANNFTGGLDSLTREVIQNSLDAVVDKNKPVTVEFSLLRFSIRDAFPFRDEYRKRVERCRDSDSVRTENIIGTAISTLNSEDLFTLKISDTNTTGLTNPLGKRASESSFYSLLKGSGISAKGTGEGGSYGLGKIAPIFCSGARAVFYYSLDIDGRTGFQGKSMLASHMWGDKDGEYLTRRVGYFGHRDRNSTPLTGDECKHLPDFLRERREPGTDIFVLGISQEEAEGWSATIKYSILSNFFIAISIGRLSCRVKEPDGTTIEITSDNLDEHFSRFSEEIAYRQMTLREEISDPDKDPFRYYEAYRRGKVVSAQESSKLAGSELYILPMVNLPQHLLPKNSDTNRSRVMYSRRPGMKVQVNQRTSTVPAVVVFVGKGERINSILQACEPAAHNEWDYKYISGNTRTNPQKKLAKECLEEMYIWIRECLHQLIPEISDDFDVVGLSSQLPMSQDTAEDPVSVELHKNADRKKVPHHPIFRLGVQNDEGDLSLGAAKLVRKGNKNTQLQSECQAPAQSASPTPDGESGQIPNPNRNNNSSGGIPQMAGSNESLMEDKNGTGTIARKHKDGNIPKTKSRKNVDFSNFRCVSSKKGGKYTIIFSPDSDISVGNIFISIVGDADIERVKINSVKLKGAPFGTVANIKDGHIILRNIASHSKVKMDVELAYKERSSLSLSIERDDNE